MEREQPSDLHELIRTQLRRLRTAAGMNQEEFGRRSNYSASLVSAVETGTRPVDRPFAKRADEVLETGGMFEELLRTAEVLRQPAWFLPYLEAERTARQLRCYQSTLVPGLLQTERYARAVIRCDDTLTDAGVERRLANRMARQAVLDQEEPPQFVAVIDEVVLRRVDERLHDVLVEQVHHLIDLAERPNISVHLVPVGVGMHAGLTGPFILARSTDDGWVGNIETQLGGVLADKDEDVNTLLSKWETVRNEALSGRQSIELMKDCVKPWI
ncbi:helix-turn-helix domain-containing protein [Micromonospora craniellae]|uniref:XRE family transcriptional regulator n=1 Tax=Micromonospora craniellae TaxID=2294034 RepID=A0A372G1W8_9ACTN|nr:helix-turn-helix transcriptional regulator [Micromonospora craniellae]QOC92792.1 helix-turn-helix domain-containing protein [Micromonospora craniellae]RFS46938.1 XRE family transcriptional regulator [Micromonospora craniellae]